MKEMEINKFLALKLEEGKTHIYVNGKKFLQCKQLAIYIPEQSIPIYDNIDSIDEAVDLHQKFLYQNKIVESPNARILRDEIHNITPEQEFWGHCSNLQAWYEHSYDTRLIHSNLAFPLLKALVEAGDPDAKRVFKTEVAERFESGHPNALVSIFANRLLEYFSLEEKKQLLQENVPVILIYIENASKHYPNLFPYIFEERLVDYLTPEQKTQLIALNYPLILKFLQKMSKATYSPKKKLYRFKDILFDHLNAEQTKHVIQSSFSVILKDIKKVGKHHPNLFLYFFEEKLLHYLSGVETMILVQHNYPVILNYVQKLSKHDPDKFIYLFAVEFLDYLHPEVKSQLIQQNYLIIFKNFHKIWRPAFADQFYPTTILDIFEERLFDYLSPEGKKQLILQNFPVLLLYIKGMSRDFQSDRRMGRPFRRMGKSNSEYKISDKKTLCYIYLTVINAIKGTSLLDDLFNAILEFSYSYHHVSSIILKAIDSIEKKQELKKSESVKVTENENLIETSNDNRGDIYNSFMNAWKAKRKPILVREMKSSNKKLEEGNASVLPIIDCKKCSKSLTPESLLILLKKERVYCPNCGIIVHRKFNPEVRTAYLEEVKTYLSKRRAPIIRFIDDGRMICPMCGAAGRYYKEFDDKSKVLYYVSVVPRYVKKYACKKCGYEF